MADTPERVSPFVSLPIDATQMRPQWSVEVNKSTVNDEHIARIETPQRTFEARHVDRKHACALVEQKVRDAEDRGEVLPVMISI